MILEASLEEPGDKTDLEWIGNGFGLLSKDIQYNFHNCQFEEGQSCTKFKISIVSDILIGKTLDCFHHDSALLTINCYWGRNLMIFGGGL